jgi:cell division protein FtsW (lipid II flippase)
MALDPPTQRPSLPASEFAVPAIMAGTVGFYLYGSLGLSSAALLFPVALMAVIVVAVIWTLIAAGWRRAGRNTASDDEVQGPIMSFVPWSLGAIPAVLILLQDQTGTLVALLAIAFAAQVVFTRTKPLRSLVVAVGVTLPVYILFKYALYVRFPVGILGIG